MKTKTIRQTVTFLATPLEVYDMLMDSRKHQSLSGEKARISKKVGGKFTAWASHISGMNLVLKPGERIVQAWRARHEVALYPDWCPAESIHRSLLWMDRDVLDADEGNLRRRPNQRPDTRQGQSQ